MLTKATLQEIGADESATPVGDPVDVQFNPASLRLQIANTIEGGESRGRQVRQYVGSSSTTLTLDLSFDTADEGTRSRPRDVRERTAMVEKFVVPAGTGSNDEKQSVPKVRFHWGNLVFDGIVDGLTIDFDHFAEDGTPLRAKMSVSIKEQNSKYQFLQAGPGANRQGGAPAPGGIGLGAVGSLGLGLSLGLSANLSLGLNASIGAEFGASFSAGFSAQASLALGGESAAEFSARMGVDPSAWRGLEGVSNPLSIPAGAEVGFSKNLSAGLGVGATAGETAGAQASPEKRAGLEAAPGPKGRLESGLSLAASGGAAAALEQTTIARTTSAATAARSSFETPRPSPAAEPIRKGPPAQPRTPLAAAGFPTLAQSGATAPGPPPPRADQRAATFGFSVPLKPRISVPLATPVSVATPHRHACGCGCKGKRS
jgi:hypothetical protein